MLLLSSKYTIHSLFFGRTSVSILFDSYSEISRAEHSRSLNTLEYHGATLVSFAPLLHEHLFIRKVNVFLVVLLYDSNSLMRTTIGDIVQTIDLRLIAITCSWSTQGEELVDVWLQLEAFERENILGFLGKKVQVH